MRVDFPAAMAAASFVAVLAAPSPAAAEDSRTVADPGAAARYLAANCANCHGTDGHAVAGAGMPSLAGLKRDYIVEQLTAFREGRRRATIMHQLSKGYTDEQIAMLADYFSRQPAPAR